MTARPPRLIAAADAVDAAAAAALRLFTFLLDEIEMAVSPAERG